uniref:Uncharacterized protein n=1 Tax=Romanomermis culicivorax TaxID=13658 RepID=A0A915K8Z8_ROMCU
MIIRYDMIREVIDFSNSMLQLPISWNLLYAINYKLVQFVGRRKDGNSNDMYKSDCSLLNVFYGHYHGEEYMENEFRGSIGQDQNYC